MALVAKNLGISITQLQGIESCSFSTANFLEKSRILREIKQRE